MIALSPSSPPLFSLPLPVAGGEPASPPAKDAEGGAGVATPERQAAKPQPKRRPKPRQLPPFNVILLDDDEHTYAYVVEMLIAVCGHDIAKAFQMAREVDKTGRVIVFTGHRELAELKREQIISYGLDPRISSCRGSMRAVIEPAAI